MPFDSAFWPLIMFLPVFVWIVYTMHTSRRNTPLTPAEKRRAWVVLSIGAGLGILLVVINLSYRVTPSPPVRALPQVQVLPAQAPAVPAPARAPQLR